MSPSQLMKLKPGQIVTIINTLNVDTPDPADVRIVDPMIDYAGRIAKVECSSHGRNIRVNPAIRLTIDGDTWEYGYNMVRYATKKDKLKEGERQFDEFIDSGVESL